MWKKPKKVRLFAVFFCKYGWFRGENCGKRSTASLPRCDGNSNVRHGFVQRSLGGCVLFFALFALPGRFEGFLRALALDLVDVGLHRFVYADGHVTG